MRIINGKCYNRKNKIQSFLTKTTKIERKDQTLFEIQNVIIDGLMANLNITVTTNSVKKSRNTLWEGDLRLSYYDDDIIYHTFCKDEALSIKKAIYEFFEYEKEHGYFDSIAVLSIVNVNHATV